MSVTHSLLHCYQRSRITSEPGWWDSKKVITLKSGSSSKRSLYWICAMLTSHWKNIFHSQKIDIDYLIKQKILWQFFHIIFPLHPSNKTRFIFPFPIIPKTSFLSLLENSKWSLPSVLYCLFLNFFILYCAHTMLECPICFTQTIHDFRFLWMSQSLAFFSGSTASSWP